MSVLILQLQVIVASIIAPLRRQSMIPARGVTFIEYALLAAIAVTIALLFRGALQTAFSKLLLDVREALQT